MVIQFDDRNKMGPILHNYILTQPTEQYPEKNHKIVVLEERWDQVSQVLLSSQRW